MSEPISRESDARVKARRRAIVDRDIALFATRQPCPDCGQTSWLQGGAGCTCVGRPTPEALRARCLANAALARTEPDHDWSTPRSVP